MLCITAFCKFIQDYSIVDYIRLYYMQILIICPYTLINKRVLVGSSWKMRPHVDHITVVVSFFIFYFLERSFKISASVKVPLNF